MVSSSNDLTYMQWFHHLNWLETQGLNPDDLLYIWRVALDRVNALPDPTGATMRSVGLGSLHSVLLVQDLLGGADGMLLQPRRLEFEEFVLNPYDHYYDRTVWEEFDESVVVANPMFAPAA